MNLISKNGNFVLIFFQGGALPSIHLKNLSARTPPPPHTHIHTRTHKHTPPPPHTHTHIHHHHHTHTYTPPRPPYTHTHTHKTTTHTPIYALCVMYVHFAKYLRGSCSPSGGCRCARSARRREPWVGGTRPPGWPCRRAARCSRRSGRPPSSAAARSRSPAAGSSWWGLGRWSESGHKKQDTGHLAVQ